MSQQSVTEVAASQSPSDIQVRVIRDERELLKLETGWNDMIRRSRFGAPFYSWAWHAKWWKHFGKGNELFIVVVEDSSGRVLALAPLMKTTVWLRGLKAREIRFASNAISPRNNVLFRNSLAGFEWLGLILKCLSQHCDEWDLITLASIPENEPYLGELYNHAAPCGLDMIVGAGRISPYIALEGSCDDYMAGNFNSKQRNNIKRRVEKLANNSDYQVTEFVDVDEMEKAVELAFAVSKASWKGEMGTDMSASTSGKSFYVDISSYLARLKQVRIWVSSIEAIPIAIQYQLASEGTVYLLVNDYDRRYQPLSPGVVLLHQVIKTLYREGVDEFDFSGEAYEYKMMWATGVRRHVTLEMFNRKYYSSFLYLAKKRILPAARAIRSAVLRK